MLTGALMVAAIALGAAAPAPAAEGVGTVTGLPLPRYVSLKPSDTPMREGPSKDNRVKWVFKREGLPLEIISEYETWRRVRDIMSPVSPSFCIPPDWSVMQAMERMTGSRRSAYP